MTDLYPFKFQPIFKDKIWGGQKIKNILGKDFGDLPNCGETWELSGVEGNISIIQNGVLAGSDLKSKIQEYQGQLVGHKVYANYGNEFPLLIKFIDANDDLSIQVHPDDRLAAKRHDSKGKTEMWYALQADPGASLISGFNRALDAETYLKFFNEGKLNEILNKETVADGDVFFLPAGRVHTIGKGLLIAEIQQTSDITYRIYDFDRVDAEGNKRELHVEEALEAIDYKQYSNYKTQYTDQENASVELVDCEYFTTNKLNLTESKNVSNPTMNSFRIYTCLSGEGQIEYGNGSVSIAMGEVVLVPACLENYSIEVNKKLVLLESYIK